MNDFILMPPPAPRVKRPRVDDNATVDKTLPNVKTETEEEEEAYEEFLCVSPDEQDPKQISFNGSDCSNDNNHQDGCEMKNQISDYIVPNVSFRDIVGQGPAKLRLEEALLPLALPGDLAETVLTGIRSAPTSILLHGPPGCGKTKLAQAVAGEARAAFFSVGPSDILSKFVGESEASIRGLFREARRKARETPSKCSVIFFDEIDALGRSRVDQEGGTSQPTGDNSSRRVLAELLIQMTGLSESNEDDSREDSINENDPVDVSFSLVEKEEHHETVRPSTGDKIDDKSKQHVIVIAATNRPEDCDSALLRRFSVRVLIALPTTRDRKKIISRLLLGMNHTITKPQLQSLARSTEGWSGSDIESMTREAVMAPVREALRATALLKKRMRKIQQTASGFSEEKSNSANLARESLLNGFRNLRPVSSRDFEDGIAFFLGDNESASNNYGHGKMCYSHYDSGDSGEDEED